MRTWIALCLIAVAAAAFAQEAAPPGQAPAQAAQPAAPPTARPVPATTPAPASTSRPAPTAPAKPPAASTPAKPAPAAAPAAAAATPARAPTATPAAVPVSAPPAATAAGASPPPALASLRGQLSLTSGGRPLRADEAVDAVVYFRPATRVPVVVPAQPLVIATERKTFVPRVLAVPVGASVRFPNNDPILHNVFSTAKEASFDLGLYGRSDGESYRFTQTGVIRVYCNVHHAMVAHVLVMDTPFFTKPDAQGRFRLVGLPAEPGELFVWHERAQLWRAAVTPGSGPDVAVKLELSRRRVPPHLNKAGQPYRRTRPDEY